VLAWLLGIVRRMAYKAIRRRPPLLSKEIEEQIPAPEESPEDLAQAGERTRWVQSALRDLSTEHREVLELVFYQGLSLGEAAEVCRCPLGTIKSRLSYARHHLRGILNRTKQGEEDW